MSKSIYEEAIYNTQILLASVDVKQLNAKKKLDMLTQIEHALQQAIKGEKLLKQHQKIASAIVRISIEQPIYVIKESERESVEHSFNRIRELENDSKRNV